jgi:hypothetical protein
VQTDITEDTIREVALPMGLVDIKVCAVDETWSGLKLVIRRKNKKGLTSFSDAPAVSWRAFDDQGGWWLYTEFLDDPGLQEEDGRWPCNDLWHEQCPR